MKNFIIAALFTWIAKSWMIPSTNLQTAIYVAVFFCATLVFMGWVDDVREGKS